MNKKMISLIISVPILFSTVIALIIIAVGVFINSGISRQKRACTQQVTAEVADIIVNESTDSNGNRKIYYYPVFRYIFNENEYITKSSNGVSPCPYTKGEKVQLYIDPESPGVYFDPNNDISGSVANSFIWTGRIFIAIDLSIAALAAVFIKYAMITPAAKDK